MIYFAECEGTGYIKIGFTRAEPSERMRELQTGNPSRVVLLASMPGDSEFEGFLHKKFAHLHVRGEWFRRGSDLLLFIADRATLATGGDGKRSHLESHERLCVLRMYETLTEPERDELWWQVATRKFAKELLP